MVAIESRKVNRDAQLLFTQDLFIYLPTLVPFKLLCSHSSVIQVSSGQPV